MVVHPYGATHYVLPRPDINQGRNAMVKEASFFHEQGGTTEDWGGDWIPVVADGLRHAHLLAWFIGSGSPFPQSINFVVPNTKTVNEIREGGFIWER